jgi:hypothetical protein
VATPWKLVNAATVSPGATWRAVWRYNHTNPFTGQIEGDWRGPQHGFATPVQLSTISGRVWTTRTGFDHTNANGVQYYADFTCDGPENGAFEVWVQGLL